MITLKKNFEEYNPDYDFLKVNKDNDIRKILRDEILYFSDNIIKINHYGMSQKRQIIVTNRAVYNLDNKSLKRKIEVKIVKGVSTSNSSDEFVIHCFELDHDYHYVSERKRKIIQFINYSYFYNKESFLPLCLIHSNSLTEFVTLKTDKKKDINFTKMPINSRMHVEEYLFGKINSDLINKDISTSTIFDFKTICLIGRGSCSKISLVEHLSTNHLYVLKTIRKDFILDYCFLENVEVEKYVLTKINHNFIINCKKILESKERIYFLMPFIKGGDLYNYLQKEKVFDEERVRFYASQICLALEELHKNNIIYRDLKLENILLDEKGYLKLIDFSSSCLKEKKSEKSYSFCGSPEYMSPEMVESRGHTFSADWWSLGILMYELLYGVTPFHDNNTDKMYELILNAELKFRDNSVDISYECKDFIKKLLIKNPNNRLGASKGFEEIKEHPFFNSLNFEGILNYDVIAPFIPDIKSNFDLSYFPEDVINEDFSDSLIGIESLKKIEEHKVVFEKISLNN